MNQAFVQACVEGRPDLIRTSFDEGLASLAISLAANESAMTNRPVRMDEFIAEAKTRSAERQSRNGRNQ